MTIQKYLRQIKLYLGYTRARLQLQLQAYNSILNVKTQMSLNSNDNLVVDVESVYTWILGVASKQLRLLHGRVGDSTIVVNSLSPQMRELVEDAIAS